MCLYLVFNLPRLYFSLRYKVDTYLLFPEGRLIEKMLFLPERHTSQQQRVEQWRSPHRFLA